MAVPQRLVGLEMRHAGRGTGGNGRRQRGGEDEARRIRPYGVSHLGACGDVAPHDAKGLAQRAVDDIDPAHQPVALGHPAAARPVHAHGMHLVEIGQRAEFVGQIADRADRAEIAVHRIDQLEGDQLGRRRIVGGQQVAQMRQVVVPEDALGPAIAAHALDHRGMVERIGIDDQAGKQPWQRRKRRVIGDIGRGEQQRGFLAVQVGQLGLQPLVIDRGARDVARPARPGARPPRCASCIAASTAGCWPMPR